MKSTLMAFRQCPYSWHKMLRLGLLTLAALNPTAFLLAQNPAREIKFERIGLEQGLSQSTVWRILQDNQGFMWFATESGLNRYDGYNITVYKHDPDDPSSLSDNNIRSIYEDHTGVLWIGTDDGLNKFDREQETFAHYKHDPNNPNSLNDNSVTSLYEDRAGVLWIGTGVWAGTGAGGLDKFDRERETFTHYQHDPKNLNSLILQR